MVFGGLGVVVVDGLVVGGREDRGSGRFDSMRSGPRPGVVCSYSSGFVVCRAPPSLAHTQQCSVQLNKPGGRCRDGDRAGELVGATRGQAGVAK